MRMRGIDGLSDVVPFWVIAILVCQSAIYYVRLLVVIVEVKREGCSRRELCDEGIPSIISIIPFSKWSVIDFLD
jgi:hypothetical protein